MMPRFTCNITTFAFGALVFAVLLSAGAPAAGAGTVYATGFEPPIYSLGALAGQDGWQVFGPGVPIVENNFVKSGTQAVFVDGSVASQSGPFHSDHATGMVSLSADIYLGSSTE